MQIPHCMHSRLDRVGATAKNTHKHQFCSTWHGGTAHRHTMISCRLLMAWIAFDQRCRLVFSQENHMRGCRDTRVRLREHPEACGAGDSTAMGRCEGALVEGMLGCGTCLWLQRDVRVTPCATCSLEMERPQIDTRQLPCKG